MPIPENTRAEFYAHFRGEPYFNMGFDEWMLSQVLAHPEKLLLRLYTWSAGTVTFGFNQCAEKAVTHELLGETPVIRRITGGRAIYHDPSELTYSIALNTNHFSGHPLGGKISEVSRLIAEVLASFLKKLGKDAAYVKRSNAKNAQPAFFNKAPCFESLAKYELTADGKKIVASAQKRHQGCLLQHGSIKLFGLADHPALNGDKIGRISRLKVIAGEDFERYAKLFLEEFEMKLEVLFEIVREETFGTYPTVVECASEVEKNFLNKRELLNK